jgi:hypothetical protein
MHFATRVRTWRVARLYSALCSGIAVSWKPFRIGHMYMHMFFLLRMVDIMTSQQINLSPWERHVSGVQNMPCMSGIKLRMKTFWNTNGEGDQNKRLHCLYFLYE